MTLPKDIPPAATPELTCRDVVEFLADYLDGTLAPATRARFEEHLAECPQCVAYLDSYRETIRLEREAFASGDEPADIPAKLIEAILAARREKS